MTNKKAASQTIADLRRFYLSDLWSFAREILGYKDLAYDPHYQVCRFIQKSRGDGSFRWSNNPAMNIQPGPRKKSAKKRKILLAPRESFKSTIVKSEVVRRFCENPYYRVLWVGYNIRGASDAVLEIANHLTNNKKIRALFGDLGAAGRSGADTYNRGLWSRECLQLFDPIKNCLVPVQNMPNLKAAGIKTGVTRLHPDLIVVDDAVCRENTSTPEGLDSVKAFFKNIEPLVGQDREEIVVGTFWDPNDAYNELIRNPDWDVFCASAINPDGTLWFPQRLSHDFLKSQERAMGTYAFSCQYLNYPIHPADVVFKPEWVHKCIIPAGAHPPLETLDIVMWIDPACKTKKNTDYTGKLITGMDRNGVLWCLASAKQKLSDSEIADVFMQDCQNWKPNAIIIEEVGAQIFLVQLVERKFKEFNLPVKVEGYVPSTRKSKEYRIRSLVPLIQAGDRIKIPEDQTELLEQLSRYQGRITDQNDLLDALAMAAEKSFPANWAESAQPPDKFAFFRDHDDWTSSGELERNFQNVF